MPPLARTERHPDEIVDEYFTYDDKQAFIKYLIGYQKTQIDWETYRKKIPDALLDKFTKILAACREYGFVRPRVRDEVLVWDRILGFKRNHANADQCTLCSKSQLSGNCRGRGKYKIGQLMFKTCWQGN